MNEMILVGLPTQFDQLAVRAAQGEDLEAELTALVTRTQEAAGTDAGWQPRIKKVRGKLNLQLEALSVPEPALPSKVENPCNQRQRAFYKDAVARLDAVIGEV